MPERVATRQSETVEHPPALRIPHVSPIHAPPGTGCSPLLPEIGVVGLVPDSWHSRWQPRHQVLLRLARYFHVVWVYPAPGWRDAFHDTGIEDGQAAVLARFPGFHIHRPEFWLPKLYRPPWLSSYTAHKRLQRSRAILERNGCSRMILYAWRPEFVSALSQATWDLTCYHIDDEYSFSPVELPMSGDELEMLRHAGQVFIHSPTLLEKKGCFNAHTDFVPNGVDFRSFSERAPEPEDLVSIRHPRVGYAGNVKKQLDWTLLLRLTAEHPEWSFIFVGAEVPDPGMKAAIEFLSRRANVHFLGAKTAQVLAAYPQYFDVCFMPYRVDDYTRCIYPLKLHEYLASGRPAVGTRLPALEPFASVVKLAETAEEWSAAIADSLLPETDSVEQRAVRQKVAEQHDWNSLVERIARKLADRLGGKYADRLEREITKCVEPSRARTQ